MSNFPIKEAGEDGGKIPLPQALWDQREKGEFTDLAIFGRECVVKAHKAILAFNYGCIGQVFQDRHAQEEDIVVIAPDFDEDVILKDLEKIYFHNLNEDQKENGFEFLNAFGDHEESPAILQTIILPPSMMAVEDNLVTVPQEYVQEIQVDMPSEKDNESPSPKDGSKAGMVCISALKRKKKQPVVQSPKILKILMYCHLCDYSCVSEKQLEQHAFNAHEPMAKCIVCGEDVKVSTLGKHTSGHYQDALKAPTQNAVVAKASSKRLKQEMDDDELKLCEICNNAYPIAEFSKHSLSHAPNEWHFECSECKLIFKDDRSLKNHVKKKHETQSKCDQCPKEACGFGTADKLEEHVRQCHNEGDYICDICENVSPNWKYFERHLKEHVIRDTVTGRHYCPYCNKELSKGPRGHGNKFKIPYEHLYIHVNPDYYRFKCSYCEQRFYSSTKRREHESAIHTGDLDWICPLCGEGFATSARRAVHKIRCKREHEKLKTKENK